MKNLQKRFFVLIFWAACNQACTAPSKELDPQAVSQTSSLQTDVDTLVADGLSQAFVVLYVRNRAGMPVPNVRATLAVEHAPQGVWLVQPGPTDSNGKTTGIVLSETEGDITIMTDLPTHTQSAQTTLRTRLVCIAPS